MAAPLKKGINYFPLESEVFGDSRFIRLKMKYGSRIMYFYLTVLSQLYSTEGYYADLRGESRENLLLYLWEKCVKYDNGTLEDAEEMLESLAASGIFNKEMAKKGILTSEHIQEVYYLATAKRKSSAVDPDLWLLPLEYMETLSKRSPIYRFFLDLKINDGNNSQRKEKEIKEKESIIKDSKGDKSADAPLPDAYYSCYSPTEAYDELKTLLVPDFMGECVKMIKWTNCLSYSIIHRYITESGVKTISQAEPFIERLMENNPCTMEDYNRLKKRNKRLFYGG